MTSVKKPALGRGLTSLMSQISPEDAPQRELPIGSLHPNRHQPRTVFREDALEELAESLRQHGMVQPIVARKVAISGQADAIICLGAVIRGATPHFDYVCSEATKGIAHVSMETGVPIGFGLLTTDNLEQAIERAGSKAGNKGVEAAAAALETLRVLQQL